MASSFLGYLKTIWRKSWMPSCVFVIAKIIFDSFGSFFLRKDIHVISNGKFVIWLFKLSEFWWFDFLESQKVIFLGHKFSEFIEFIMWEVEGIFLQVPSGKTMGWLETFENCSIFLGDIFFLVELILTFTDLTCLCKELRAFLTT